MAVSVSGHRESATVPSSMAVTQAATLGAADVLARLGTGTTGLPADEAARRLQVAGPNAVRSYRARAWPVLRSQLRSPLLLLAVTALASAFLGHGQAAGVRAPAANEVAKSQRPQCRTAVCGGYRGQRDGHGEPTAGCAPC